MDRGEAIILELISSVRAMDKVKASPSSSMAQIKVAEQRVIDAARAGLTAAMQGAPDDLEDRLRAHQLKREEQGLPA